MRVWRLGINFAIMANWILYTSGLAKWNTTWRGVEVVIKYELKQGS